MKDKVYYDESCYVCSLEINSLRKRGERCGIEFVDITGGDFPAEYMEEMMGEFAGEQTRGVETFRLMYERLGFKRAIAFSRLPVIRGIVNISYKLFAYGIRPYLPKKRVKND